MLVQKQCTMGSKTFLIAFKLLAISQAKQKNPIRKRFMKSKLLSRNYSIAQLQKGVDPVGSWPGRRRQMYYIKCSERAEATKHAHTIPPILDTYFVTKHHQHLAPSALFIALLTSKNKVLHT